MRLDKDILLNYGIAKGYYTDEERDWCAKGNNIKDYVKKDSNLIDNFSLLNHINRINEIAVRNELPVLQVAGIYAGANTKIYTGDLSNIGQSKYNPILEEKVFNLTERYIDRQRLRELNKIKRN